MKKITIIFFLLFLFLLISITQPIKIEAAKKFVPKKTTTSTSVKGGSIPSIVRYRGDKLGILLSLTNFSGLEKVSYSFTYDTNGMAQGAGGAITNANSPTAQRELLFGTCSSGVCRYHYNLSNARLVLTAKFTSGRTVSKAYRIKTYQ